MADRKPRGSLREKTAIGSRDNDRSDRVSSVDPSVDASREEDRQIRETLAEYFAVLREWDLKLRRDTELNSELEQP
jgi:hypothetical protein